MAMVRDLAYMLYSVHPTIFKAAIDSDLAKELADRDSEVSRQGRRIGEIIELYDGCIPCIYVHFLMNARGDAPTRYDMQKVCQDVQRYAEGDDDVFAKEIDCVINVKPVGGPRHGRYIADHVVRRVILEFLNDLERGLGAYPLAEPFPLPMGEVGYYVETLGETAVSYRSQMFFQLF